MPKYDARMRQMLSSGLSRLSCSVCLIHWWIWPASNEAIVRGLQRLVSNPIAVFLISMLIGTALSFVIAGAMFVLVEHPFLLLRDRGLRSTFRATVHGEMPATSSTLSLPS
ncbi:MAG: hypothetical protein ABIZ91_01110 [Gemmatimonadaceae bacterium]